MHAALTLKGPLDVDALRDTINDVVRRHEALRTQFALSETGDLSQVIVSDVRIDLPLEDMSHVPQSAPTKRLPASPASRHYNPST